MKSKFVAVALGFALVGCGRDALVAPNSVATVTLTCPTAGDDGSGARGGNKFFLSQALSPIPSCTFDPPKVSDAEAMEALVRLVTGEGDPKRAREFTDKGLLTKRVADRNTVITALLSDANARAFSDAWMAAWLQLPASTPFPERVSSSLWQDALQQTFRNGRVVFVDGTDKLASLVNGTSTFLTRELAALYNVTPPSNAGFALTKTPPGRPGVFGHASVLASHPSVSSRGDLLLEAALICSTAPPPPEGIGAHIIKPTKLIARAAHDKQIVDPVCSSCHQMLKAGFLLHAFDERGVGRTQDADGMPVNTRVEVQLMERAADLVGLPAFAEALGGTRGWHTCLAKALVDVAAQRAQLGTIDGECSAESVATALRQSPTLKSVLPAVATTLFGGTLSGQTVSDPPGPPPEPPSPSLDVDGKLSACTPITQEDLTCDSVCKNEGLTCGDHTCRLAGTLGGAFFFKSRSACSNQTIGATLNRACEGGFAGAACQSSAPLAWVRCCCGE